MDFSLNDTQQMLADSIEKYLANEYDFATRQANAASESGYGANAWRTFAELGWTAVPFAEDDGGIGGGPVDMMVVMERFGRGLVVEPYLANVVLAGGILKRLAGSEQKQRWLLPMISGDLQTALAFTEPQSGYDIANIRCTARREGKDWLLNGLKGFVLNGRNAELIIVPARTAGDSVDTAGITVFAVDANAPGLRINDYATVDGHQAAEVTLADVRVAGDAVLGDVGSGFDALDATLADATLAVCAEAVGIMEVLKDRTVEYAKNRIQFGVPIGSFQALQHRMVDMLMDCEQTRSLLMWAVMVNAAGAPVARQAISAIKYQVGVAGTRIGEEAVQIHGGMGVTWELDVAHYFKRLVAIGRLFGDADRHLDRLAI